MMLAGGAVTLKTGNILEWNALDGNELCLDRADTMRRRHICGLGRQRFKREDFGCDEDRTYKVALGTSE